MQWPARLFVFIVILACMPQGAARAVDLPWLQLRKGGGSSTSEVADKRLHHVAEKRRTESPGETSVSLAFVKLPIVDMQMLFHWGSQFFVVGQHAHEELAQPSSLAPLEPASVAALEPLLREGVQARCAMCGVQSASLIKDSVDASGCCDSCGSAGV